MSGTPTSGHRPRADHKPASRPESTGIADNASQCDILLLYVNDIEQNALVETITADDGTPSRLRIIGDLAVLDIGVVGGLRVFATGTNMGSATSGGSATVTLDAIHELQPKQIIAVGVAFGMDEEKTPLGTILVSEKVSNYELQRIGEKLTLQRGDIVSVHLHLKQRFKLAYAKKFWTGASVKFGELLSGEKLIDDPAFKNELKTYYPEAIGGEMEAAGIYSAASLKRCDWIVVKAVCDFADGNKGSDKKARQTEAANNAAAFVHHVLTAYPSDSLDASSSPPETQRGETAGDPTPSHDLAKLHHDAHKAIGGLLESHTSLRKALHQVVAKREGRDEKPEQTAAELTDWLLQPGPAALSTAINSLRAAIPLALKTQRTAGLDVQPLCDAARRIMGRIAVTAVTADYCHEGAPGVARWGNQMTFAIPLGARECVETLWACWRGDGLDCYIERDNKEGVLVQGLDNISSNQLPDIEFDDPGHLGSERLIDTVWRLVYKRLNDTNTAPPSLSDAEKTTLRSMMKKENEYDQRRRHFIIDRVGVGREFAEPSVVHAIHVELPLLRLMVIDANGKSDEKVFALPEADLAADIRRFLLTIETCQ